MLESLSNGLTPGSIILLHDAVCDQRYRSRKEMLMMLQAFLAQWSDAYEFVTVPELMNLGRPIRRPGLKKPNHERFATYEKDFY